MLISQLGHKGQLGWEGLLLGTSLPWILSPTLSASISPMRGGRAAGTGACLHVLVLVGALIGCSW